jgi:hypothetical protein
MEKFIILFLAIAINSNFAFATDPCKETLNNLEQNYKIDRRALSHALKNATDKTRYVAIAKVIEDNKNAYASGDLNVLDLQTGRVTSFKSLQIGASKHNPQINLYASGSLDGDGREINSQILEQFPRRHGKSYLTGSGARTVTERDNVGVANGSTSILEFTSKSPGLINELNNRYENTNDRKEFLVNCSRRKDIKKIGEIESLRFGQVLCLQGTEYNQFAFMVRNSADAVFYSYPDRNSNRHFNDSKLDNDSHSVCKRLQKVTLNRTSGYGAGQPAGAVNAEKE